MNKLNFKNNKKIYQKGQTMLTVVFIFIFIFIIIISSIVPFSIEIFKISKNIIYSKKSFFLSEAGIEDVIFRLKTAKPITSPVSLSLDNGSNIATITDISGKKIISSLGDFYLRKRTNEITVTAGTGISFNYGIQAGKGGLIMGNNSKVIGSVYSNGQIIGGGIITGSATSANSPDIFADQINDYEIYEDGIVFGNTNLTQDFAQSFKLSSSKTINKIDLYLKKINTPSNLTIRIVEDNNGNPGVNQITFGTLSSSLISSNYGWVSVMFSSNPFLFSNKTYWFIIDGATNDTNYYKIGANINGYINGVAKIGNYSSIWNDTNPSTLDSFFKIYLDGGTHGLINGITIGSNGVGNAYAHMVNNSTIAGINYCKMGYGNNKKCDTSILDPVSINMPISEQNIEDWKNDAKLGGVYLGDLIISGKTIYYGPKKITGKLVITNGADVTINDTLWVEGDFIINNNSIVRLSSNYGSSEGVIVVDGIVEIGNNAMFYGSGVLGSYPMILSTSTLNSAINLANNAGAVILYASNGTVNISNNAGAVSINGYSINLNNNAIINYNNGLINSNFVSGPTGGWNIIDWKEIK